MKDDIIGLIRALLFSVMIFVFIAICMAQGPAEEPTPTEATAAVTEEPAQETATPPETTPTEPAEEETQPHRRPTGNGAVAATEPPAPRETEPPTETTPPTTEPPSAPEPTAEPTIATEPTTEPTEAPTEETEPTEPDPTGEWRSLGTYSLTAYCACKKCCGKDPGSPEYGITATGATAEAGVTIAVDPSSIPLGSEVKINDHIYIAQDTGGAINGYRIDVYFDDHQEALQFGRQSAEVFIRS